MSRDSKEDESVAAPPEVKPKLTLVVILSVLTGVLLTLVTGVTIYHFQSAKALGAELATAKGEIKRKAAMLTESQEQVAALSKQVHALRGFSVAKASDVAEDVVVADKLKSPAAPTAPIAPAASAPAASAPVATKKEPAAVPVEKPSKPKNLDCQLVGKSAEEQMATLQRCAKAMDGKK
jgi:hypothetical protein